MMSGYHIRNAANRYPEACAVADAERALVCMRCTSGSSVFHAGMLYQRWGPLEFMKMIDLYQRLRCRTVPYSRTFRAVLAVSKEDTLSGAVLLACLRGRAASDSDCLETYLPHMACCIDEHAFRLSLNQAQSACRPR
jgi:hypothetical protein